jgi:hypothetical protein
MTYDQGGIAMTDIGRRDLHYVSAVDPARYKGMASTIWPDE